MSNILTSTLGKAYVLYKRDMLIFKSNLRSNIVRTILFPLIILIFFSNIGAVAHNVPVGVVNNANNANSYKFMQSLYATSSNGAFKVITIPSISQGMSEVNSGQVALLLILNPTIGDSSSSATGILAYYSSPDASTVDGILPIISGVASQFYSGVGTHSIVPINAQPQAPDTKFVPTLTSGLSTNYEDFLVGGVIALVAVFGTLFGGGFTLITDKQLGNLKALLITPLNRASVMLGKTIYTLTLSVISTALVIVISLFLGVTILMGLIGVVWIFIIVLMLTLGFTGISLILATRVKKPEIYAIFTQTIALPLWFLSGAFFPAASMPTWMRLISQVNPMTYAVDGIRDVMITGSYPLSTALPQLAILALFAVITLGLAIKLFKVQIA
ncbi:MAG: ABC transporter permease [Candidatus Marsarchaeota archaeon]|nr:ABC transporter permease [Candidatus Marsarchaeota archaeon]